MAKAFPAHANERRKPSASQTKYLVVVERRYYSSGLRPFVCCTPLLVLSNYLSSITVHAACIKVGQSDFHLIYNMRERWIGESGSRLQGSMRSQFTVLTIVNISYTVWL